MAAPISIREGRPGDLVACTSVWRSTIDPALPPAERAYDLYRHEVDTGTLVVAERGGEVCGFGGTTTRDGRWFVADLFVSPAAHGQGIGRRLVNALVDADRPGPVRATMGSTDPRALTLYAQLTMAPRWPCFTIAAPADRLAVRDGSPASVEQCDAGDLVGHTTSQGYALHRVDLDYWLAAVETHCLVVRSGPAVIGGGVVRWATPASTVDPAAISLGPVFARGPGSMLPTASALLHHALAGAEGRMIRCYVPGPNPALAPLLAAGFHIRDLDFFCCAGDGVLDPHSVFPSFDLL